MSHNIVCVNRESITISIVVFFNRQLINTYHASDVETMTLIA
jgi:hypothetical protein